MCHVASKYSRCQQIYAIAANDASFHRESHSSNIIDAVQVTNLEVVRCSIVVIARIPVRTDTALKSRVTVCTSAIYRGDAGCILTSSLFAAESLQISMRLHRCVTSRRDFRKVPSDFRTVDLSRIMHRSFVGHRAYADTGNDDQSASTTLNRGRVCAVVQLCFMTHKQGV